MKKRTKRKRKKTDEKRKERIDKPEWQKRIKTLYFPGQVGHEKETSSRFFPNEFLRCDSSPFIPWASRDSHVWYAKESADPLIRRLGSCPRPRAPGAPAGPRHAMIKS